VEVALELARVLDSGESSLGNVVKLQQQFFDEFNKVRGPDKFPFVRDMAYQFAQLTELGRMTTQGFYDPYGKKRITKLEDLREEYDPDSDYVRYSDISKSHPDYSKELKEAESSAILAHHTGVWNTIRIIVGTYVSSKRDVRLCPVWGYMYWLLSQYEEEPFIQLPRGGVRLQTQDWVVTKRIGFLMNVITWWSDFGDTGLFPVDDLLELVPFLLVHPMERALMIKKSSGIYTQLSGAGTTGDCVRWSRDMSKTWVAKINPRCNGASIALSLKDEFKEELDGLRELGLNRTADRRASHVNGTMSMEMAAEISVDRFLEACTGFLYNHNSNALTHDMKDASENVGLPNPRLGKHLWDLNFRCYREARIPSKSEWNREVQRDLTTRSAGLPKEERPSLDIDVGQSRLKVSVSSKVMMYHIDEGFRRFGVNDKNMNEMLVKELAGDLATRNVPSRRTRAVMMGKPSRAAMGSLFRREKVRFQNNLRLGTTNTSVTTFATMSGIALKNHATFIRASSSDVDQVTFLLDYSAFDQTHQAMFAHIFASSALEALKTRPEALVPISENGLSYLDMVVKFYSDVTKLRFRVYHGVQERYHHYRTRFLASGEPDTIVRNNDVNIAQTNVFMEDVFSKYSKWWSLPTTASFQGDDQILVCDLHPAFLALSNEERADIYREFRKDISDSAKASGLTINPNKMGIMENGHEYLKVASLNGWSIPRLTQLQPNQSERDSNAEDPIDKFSAMQGTLRERINRGFSSRLGILRLCLEQPLVFSVSAPRQPMIRLPFVIAYLPLADGGCGFNPFNVTQPNADTVQAETVREPWVQDWMWKCKEAISRIDVRPVSDGIITAVRERMSKAIEHIKRHEDQQLVKNSEAARAELLRSYGYDDSRNTYNNRHEAMMKATIEENPSWRSVRVRHKYDRWRRFVEIFNEIKDQPSKMPLRNWTWQRREVEPERAVDFVPLDAYMRRWVKQIGTGIERSDVQTADDLLGRVTNSPDFPSQLPGNSTEALAQTMISEKLTSVDAIRLLLVSRGARPEMAQQTAQQLEGKLYSLLFMQRAHKYSVASDGYTNKSFSRLSGLVDYSGDPSLRETAYMVGGQVSLSEDIRNPRRRVSIYPTGTMVGRLKNADSRSVEQNVANFIQATVM
jgi:hypothetical protein